jgi:hypothetical protein
MTHDIILSVTYACYNIDAGCCKVNETTKWKSPKTFTTYESGFWMQYLKEVWEWYDDFITKIKDTSTRLMLSPGLVDKLLFDSSAFEHCLQKLNSSLQHYYTFIKEQIWMKPTKTSGVSQQCMTLLCLASGQLSMKISFSSIFKCPALILSRKFSIMCIVLLSIFSTETHSHESQDRLFKWNNGFARFGGSNNVQVKILGEYGHIMSFTHSEGKTNQMKEQLLFFFYCK